MYIWSKYKCKYTYLTYAHTYAMVMHTYIHFRKVRTGIRLAARTPAPPSCAARAPRRSPSSTRLGGEGDPSPPAARSVHACMYVVRI